MKSFADELKNIEEIDDEILERINLYEAQIVLQKGKRQHDIRINNLRAALTGIFIMTAAILLILAVNPQIDKNSSSGTGITSEEGGKIIPKDSVLYYQDTIPLLKGDELNITAELLDGSLEGKELNCILYNPYSKEQISVFKRERIKESTQALVYIKNKGDYVLYVYGKEALPEGAVKINYSIKSSGKESGKMKSPVLPLKF